MMFAWMDRMGFNYALPELSLDLLEDLARRGGRYWIVHEDELQTAGLADSVSTRFSLVAACACECRLYDLLGATGSGD
jgi:hypothetical protein